MITIRDHIEGLVRAALAEAQSQGLLPEGSVEGPLVERPQRAGHGDFASSAPMRLARSMRMSPMVIAEKLVSAMPEDETVGAVSVAPPGFVNIALSPDWLVRQVDAVIRAGACYGNVDAGAGKRVQLEFVSVNPTGPVHVGHARGAVFGSALAEVMAAAGYDVQREYYFNDAGSQMERFNLSLLARYLQQHGREAEVPEDGYVGEYMVDLAREIVDEVGAIYLDAPEDEAAAGLGALGLQRMTAVARDDMRDLRGGIRQLVHRAQPLRERPVRPGDGAARRGRTARPARRGDVVQVVHARGRRGQGDGAQQRSAHTTSPPTSPTTTTSCSSAASTASSTSSAPTTRATCAS